MAITSRRVRGTAGRCPVHRDRTAEGRATRPATFDSTSPATGEVVATFPVDGPEQVAAAVARARQAQRGWAELGFDGRQRAMLACKALLVRRTDELVALVHRENGKPDADALIEVLMIVEHLDWAARNAARVLGPRRVRGTLVLANHAASVEYQPLGVVGVIGPWNYPVFTPLGSIAYALAAGNAVVFKPSELTPAVGCFLADTFADAVGGQPVLQVVTGDGATGHALCLAGVDKVALTGSPATGRKVMAACAEGLTPVVLELGGKDAMVVDADADLDAAAEQAVWGGMANAGQTCLAVERVYVVDAVYDRFLDKLVERASRLRPGGAPTPTSAPSPCPGSSRSSSGIWTTPSPAGPGPWSAAATRSTALCRPRGAGRRARRRPGHAGGDLRPRPPRDQGPRRRPCRRPGQRQPLRPGRLGVRHPPRRAHRPRPALGHGQHQLGPDLRRHAVAAPRRRRRVQLRPHPRPRRPPRVHPPQGHHPPALPLPFPMQSFDRPRYVLPAVRQAKKLRHGRAPRRRP